MIPARLSLPTKAVAARNYLLDIDYEWWSGPGLGIARLTSHGRCTDCGGTGMRQQTTRTPARPCGCSLRAVFRASVAAYRDASFHIDMLIPTNLDHQKHMEFCADFELLCRRHCAPWEMAIIRGLLRGEEQEQALFRHIPTSRPNPRSGWHYIYGLEEKIGLWLAQTRPYPLFPRRNYYADPVRRWHA